MHIALLGCALCGSIVYDPHKSSSLRDPAAQTAVGGIQSAGPPLILSCAVTSLRVTTAWAYMIEDTDSFSIIRAVIRREKPDDGNKSWSLKRCSTESSDTAVTSRRLF